MTPQHALILRLQNSKFSYKSKICFENWAKSPCFTCENCTIRTKNVKEEIHVHIKCSTFNQFLSNYKGYDETEIDGELNEAPIQYCFNCAPPPKPEQE